MQTFEQLIKGYIKDDEGRPVLAKAVSQMGAKLLAWSAPVTKTMDLDDYYRTEENVRKRIFRGPDVAIPSLGMESVHALFQALLRTMEEKGALVTTTEGRTHGDLHGGNLLLDVAGNVWLIDFATTGPGCCRGAFCRFGVGSGSLLSARGAGRLDGGIVLM